MRGLNFISDEFLNTQERIALLGQVQGRTTARQQVRAQAQMYSSTAFAKFVEGPAGKLSLPNTTAALQLEVTELQQKLVNLDRSSSDYTATAMRLADAQRKLAQDVMGLSSAYDKLEAAEAGVARRAGKVAGIQQYYAGGAGAPGVAGFRDPATGAIIARGAGNVADRRAFNAARRDLANAILSGAIEQARTLALPAAGGTAAPGTGQAISGGARRIGVAREVVRGAPSVDIAPAAVGMSEQAIRSQTQAVKEAASSLMPYRAAIREAAAANNGSIRSLEAYRAALVNMRNEVPATSASFERLTKRIQATDDQLEKLAMRQRGRRRMSPMQMTQAAGAAISGGIFGGPEGFLGGVGGALVGGVGGAFAGAAIGAQVGGLRRQLGEFADYAAGIQRLQIALKGVAGSQVEFNRAMAAASSVTKELNVPQDVAIQGMTRLTAAVKGAGGGVADAELAFKNINSAIIATGGGAEQVEGAVTALVQIFSKGKVSAEEINQIAERLPGTFNKIAEASGRTGPELTKALQDGKVGLNDLMKFLVQLGGDYNALAEKIAQSSESAGARLQVAYDKMRQEVGKALQPIGAEFQAAFADFVEDVTPALVAVLPSIGQAALALAKNIDTLAVAVVSFGSAFAAIKFAAIISSLGGIASAAGLAGKSLAAMNLAAMVNPAYLLAAGVAALGVSLYNTWRQQEEFNRVLREAPLDEVNRRIDELRQSINDLDKKSRSAASGMSMFGGSVGFASAQAAQLKQDLQDLIARQQELALYEQAGVRVRPGFYGPGFASPPEQKPLTDFKPPALEDADKGAAKAARDAERRAEEIARLKRAYDLLFAKRQILTVDMQLLDAARFIDQAEKENNAEAVDALRRKQSDLAFEKDLLAAKIEYDGTAREIRETLEGQQRTIAESTAQEQLRQSINVALGEQMSRILTIEQDITDEKKKQRQAIEAELTDRKRALGLISDDEYNAALMERESRRLREQFPREAQGPQRAELLDLYRQEIDPTPFESMRQNITQLKDELRELVDPVNQITSAATAIGDAFSQSFVDAISGASTAKEALASFFQSVGSYFLDMAKQIIAKMIQIAILNSVAKLLPGSLGGFSLGGTSFGAGGGEVGGIGTLGPNFGIAQRAMGGPVNANQPYIVGERGPELFVPFQQGSITSNEAMQQASMAQLPFTRNAESISQATQTAQAMQAAGPINVKYESTVINGVEYVSAEQHRKGMAEAAERGRALTLQTLQNSVRTRSKVGL